MMKAEAIEIAARAEFESMKQSIAELEGVEWDGLPDVDDEWPTPRSKAYYRHHVSTAVEALARAHMLVEHDWWQEARALLHEVEGLDRAFGDEWIPYCDRVRALLAGD
jgi:hypothetical protein